jgi:gamma-glutamyltranspeptidase
VSDSEYWHYAIESWKLRDAVSRIADPAQWAVDYEEHLRPTHAASLFRRIKREAALRFPEDSDEITGGPERIGSGTSGFVIADGDGNIIAVTQNAEHVGRLVLRDAGSRLSLQQSSEGQSHDAGRLRSVDAADAIEHCESAAPRVQGAGK